MFDYFRVVLIGFALLTALSIVAVLLMHQVRSYNESVAKIRQEKIQTAEQFVRNMISIESSYIAQVKKSFDERKVGSIENNVQEAYNLASTIYNENKGRLSEAQIKRLIIKSLASLGSASTRQHVAINDLQGRGVYNPTSPAFDGKSLLHIKDRTGSYFAQEEIKIVKERGEGFRYASDTITKENKVVFVKEFPAYDWYFVSLVYPSDYYKELVAEVANKVSVKFFGYKGDAFIVEEDGRAVTSMGKVFDDVKQFNLSTSTDPAARNAFKVLTDSLEKHPEGSFVNYPWYMRDLDNDGNVNVLSEKISYVQRDTNLGWIIGAGFFVSEVDEEIALQVDTLRDNFMMNLLQIIFLFALILLIEILLLRWFEGQFKRDFNNFVSFFKKSSQELNYLDLEDMYSKEFRELGEVANEMIAARQVVEKRLLDEQEKAQEADRLKSSFLANMSHEIRTPMNAIIGFSNFLVEDLSVEERKEFVGLIRNSGDSLLSLIDSIIDFSKIEVGQIVLNENYVSYDKVCFNLSERYNRLIEEDSLSIEFKIENTLPIHFMSVTDESRLTQVLKHLLDNAFKFTSSGQVVLNIEQRGDRIYFKVSDTGIGIAEDNLSKVFERFTQIEGNLSRNYGGTGIGLAIASKLVEMLGGEIWVESTLGKGSKFQFFIPLVIE
ncbi:MAG: cache domain-containing protein [Mangrovibacterium sp.]